MDRRAAQKHKIKNNNAIKPSLSCLKLLLETSPKSLHHLSLHQILYEFALSLCVKNEKKLTGEQIYDAVKKNNPPSSLKLADHLGHVLFSQHAENTAPQRDWMPPTPADALWLKPERC